MAYNKYGVANNARGPILTGISAGSVTLVLQSGYGASFPASNFLITAEKYDRTVTPNIVTKREIILVDTRTGDSFDITGGRGAGSCPPSDSVTTPGTTAYAFDTGDIISLYTPAEVITDMQNEITRLETDKANVADIQKGTYVYQSTSVGTDSYAITPSPAISAYFAGMVFQFLADVGNTGAATLNISGLGALTIKKLHDQDLTTGDIEAGQIVQVAYDGTNLQMQSVIAMVPTPDVNGLTEDTAPDMDNDFFLEYDVSGAVNKKSKMSRFKASDADVLAGTSTTTLPTTKQTTDLVLNTGFVASANLKISADTSRNAVVNGTKALIKSIQIGDNYKHGGTIRVKFDIIYIPGTWGGTAQIYKNGSAFGTLRSATASWVTHSEDLTFAAGDFIQLYGQTTNDGTTSVRNFQLFFDEVKYAKLGTVITD